MTGILTTVELKLHFREKEFRDLYEKSYQSSYQQLQKQLSKRARTRNILASSTAVSFILASFYMDWIYCGLILLFITIQFIAQTELIKRKTKKLIRTKKREVDEFVAKTNQKRDIKYSYDNEYIRYLESGEALHTFLWKDLASLEKQDGFFILHFSANMPTIMIPRAMAESREELLQFESKAEEMLPKTPANNV